MDTILVLLPGSKPREVPVDVPERLARALRKVRCFHNWDEWNRRCMLCGLTASEVLDGRVYDAELVNKYGDLFKL